MRAAVDEAVDSVVAKLAREREQEHKRHEVMLLVLAAAALLQSKLSSIIATHRQDARVAAAKRLHVELGAVGVTVAPHLLVVPGRAHALDVAHAESASQSLAAAWQASAVAAAARQPDAQNPYRAIDRTRVVVRYRVDRTAATEIASAYNDEHSRALRDAAERDPELLSALDAGEVVRIWSAYLDRRTCAECAARDGTELSRSEIGPPAHPLCRCVAYLERRSLRAAA